MSSRADRVRRPADATASRHRASPRAPIVAARGRRDARLERAAGTVPPPGGGRARAREAGRPSRRFGRPALRRSPERRRAAGRPGSPACPRPRARRGSRGTAASRAYGAASPTPGEGPPAAVLEVDGSEVLRGVKTFCSGAGGLDRALSSPARRGRPTACGVDRSHRRPRVEVDADLVRGPTACARRFRIASCSTTRRCSPGSARRGRWPSSRGSRATRCAPRQAGRAWPTPPLARALDGARRRGLGAAELEALAAGRILTAQRTIDLWIEPPRARDGRRRRRADRRSRVHARAAISDACRDAARRGRARLRIEAVRACRGARPGAARPRGVPAPAPARPDARPRSAKRRSGER